MVFSSLLFLFRFLPAVLLLYYIAPRKFRNVILLLFSLFFYAWGEPKYVLLMLCSITVDFFIGKKVDWCKKRGRTASAREWLSISLIYNIAVLCFFKYLDFLIGSINAVFGTAIPLTGIPLPIGISFFTFQTMSYTIDVYLGVTEVQTSWIKYGTYVSMFSQLIAGPIVQYKTIAQQMETRRENAADFAEGVHRFMIGFGKKVLLANNIGVLWDTISVMGAGSLPVATAWLGAAAYAFQIYFDFSGYSDMAIGLGKMFGFHFLENFNYPYISTSITEFWRRWHISLSSWFREYVYIPLGGNRRGIKKQIRNIAVVWMLTGIWHGASWNFVLWGVYYGILLIIEKFVLKDILIKLPRVFRHIYALFFVLIGWVIFAFDKIAVGVQYIGAMFGGAGAGLVDSTTIYLLYNYAVLLVIRVLASTELPKKVAALLIRKAGENNWLVIIARLVFYAGVFFLGVAYLVDATYNPFLYFRF